MTYGAGAAATHEAVPLWPTVAGAALLGLFLAVIGPYGSYLNGGFPARAAYWIGAMGLGVAIYGGAFHLALALLSGRSPWLAAGVAVLAGSLVQAAATRATALALWPELARLGPGPVTWYAQVVALAIPLTVGYGLFRRRLIWPQPAGISPFVDGEPPLLDRLPPHIGRELMCLQMEDHYVRVHTRRGSALLLMPFGQAIAAASPIEGQRTHRSWWVARTAVLRVEGGARAMRLHLVNGLTAPVARPAVARLRAMGWLAMPPERR